MGTQQPVVLTLIVLFLILTPIDGNLQTFITCLHSYSNIVHSNRSCEFSNWGVAIVRPATEKNVAKAVRCAQRAQLRVCLRPSGHSLAWQSLCDDNIDKKVVARLFRAVKIFTVSNKSDRFRLNFHEKAIYICRSHRRRCNTWKGTTFW